MLEALRKMSDKSITTFFEKYSHELQSVRSKVSNKQFSLEQKERQIKQEFEMNLLREKLTPTAHKKTERLERLVPTDAPFESYLYLLFVYENQSKIFPDEDKLLLIMYNDYLTGKYNIYQRDWDKGRQKAMNERR